MNPVVALALAGKETEPQKANDLYRHHPTRAKAVS
jgi:hypothetical protein